jgi:hypothetical protein
MILLLQRSPRSDKLTKTKHEKIHHGRYWLAVCCLFISPGQTKPKFNKIGVADFKVLSPVVDSNANAVILADVGSTEFVGNNNGDFSLVFKQHKRILLRNRNSFEEATVKVPVYLGTDFTTEERFEDFEATTYNIENGQVVATKLDKASVFKEKVSHVNRVSGNSLSRISRKEALLNTSIRSNRLFIHVCVHGISRIVILVYGANTR